MTTTALSAITSFLVGARQTAGFYRYEYEGLYRGDLIDIPSAFNQNAHIAKNFLALCKAALADKQHYPNYTATRIATLRPASRTGENGAQRQ